MSDEYQPKDVARFWGHVDKSGDCWMWARARTTDGYAFFKLGRKMIYGHRFAWELTNGPIPEGLRVDHICRSRSCVNPSHMRLATGKQNSEHQAVESTRARSGVRGVVWNGTLKKWMPQVRHNGKLHIGGYFSTVEEAAEAVRDLRNKLYTRNDLDRVE